MSSKLPLNQDHLTILTKINNSQLLDKLISTLIRTEETLLLLAPARQIETMKILKQVAFRQRIVRSQQIALINSIIHLIVETKEI